jgi:hypothetical protein
MKNGDEAGVDCGGLFCPPCYNNGAATVQRSYLHFRFGDVDPTDQYGWSDYNIAVDTAGERVIIGTGNAPKKVFVAGTDGTDLRELFDYEEWRTGCPCRAPFVHITAGGDKVLWTDGLGEIWVANFDGSGQYLVADTIPNANELFNDFDLRTSTTPKFTHAGDHIIFSNDFGGQDNIGLYMVPTEGGRPEKFVSAEDIGGDDPNIFGGGNFTGLSISAENDILFASTLGSNANETQVFLYNKEGGRELIFDDGPRQGFNQSLFISRDGRKVLVNENTPNKGTIKILDRPTNQIELLDMWDGTRWSLTLSANDDAGLILANNYCCGGSQSDVLINPQRIFHYPLYQRETPNKFQDATNMQLIPNGKKIVFNTGSELWITELSPEEPPAEFPYLFDFTLQPNWVAASPVTSSTFRFNVQNGTIDPVDEVSFVELDAFNLPYNRLLAVGAPDQSILANDGSSFGDELAGDNIHTHDEIVYRSLGPNFPPPDTLTVRLHIWSKDRIASYDIYPFFVTDEPLTPTSDLKQMGYHFSLRPNVGEEMIFLHTETTTPGNLTYQIVSSAGKPLGPLVSKYLPPGVSDLTVNTSQYPAGMYFLMLRVKGKRTALPFIKMK